MSIILQRGGNVSLKQAQQVSVALGWDASRHSSTSIDLDTSAFMVDHQGQVLSDEYFIFFNNPTSPDGSVEHQGNNTTGLGGGDDELIEINLSRVESQVQKIVFTVTIYEAEARHQHFGMVDNAYIRLVNPATREELARYNLTEQFTSETAMIFGELYRYKGLWKFRAVGQGFAGGLSSMAQTFGVRLADGDEDEDENQPLSRPSAPDSPPRRRSEQPTVMSRSATPPSPPSRSEQATVLSPHPAPAQYGGGQQASRRSAAEPPIREVARGGQLAHLTSALDYELLYPGPFATVKVRLKQGEMIKAESDAMVAMSSTIDVEGKLEGGIFAGLGRLLAGEKFFFQKLVAKRGPGEVLLAHSIPGEIKALELDGSNNYVLQKDGFFAASDTIKISTKVQNLARGLFSGEGFFVLKVSGEGTLFVSSYGAIHTIDVPPGEEIIIDNGHLVAWPDGMFYRLEKASAGWISSFTSGEGIVCRFKGPGRVLIQTRNPSGFGSWVKQFIPAPSGGGSRSASSSSGEDMVRNVVRNRVDDYF